MFGAISGWLYSGIGGILTDEEAPGFKNVILKPQFVEGLASFEAIHKSPYGKIVSKWERVDKQVNYKVDIPNNSSGTLFLTANKVIFDGKELNQQESAKIELGSGQHKFEIFE